MKLKYILPLLLSLLVCFGLDAKKKAAQPKLTFTETSHNFGNIKANGKPVSCEFTFTNTGTGNLVITDATAECGCTKPEFPQNPIAPGKTGKIRVTFNPVIGPGGFQKTITVRSNSKPEKSRVKISGVIVK